MSKLSEAVAGRVVTGVRFSEDEDRCFLWLEGERELELHLEADCCSGSYFTKEGRAELESLLGMKLRSMEEVESPRTDNTDCTQEETRWYMLKVEHDGGSVTVDWRNDSNGYYSGWLNWHLHDGAAPPVKARR